MASAAELVQQPVIFDAIRTRTRRECRLFSRALMRLPRQARIAIGVGFGILTIVALYALLPA